MGSKTCGAESARARLPELLDAARQGNSTIITKRGRPCAALVPVAQATPPPKGPSLLDLRGTGAGLWGKSVSGFVARMRDQWR
jgi:prevent-host-death family protein